MYAEDLIREKQKDQALKEATTMASLSGAGTGAGFGAFGSLMGGRRALADYAKSSLLGGLAGSALSGGSVYTGGKLLGVEDDPGAFTRMGGLGGAIAGGLVGGGLGAAAGGLSDVGAKAIDYMPDLVRNPTQQAIKDNTDNIIGDAFRRFAKGGRLSGALKGGLVGGAALSAIAAMMGSDEGMQVDYINSELERYNRNKLKRELEQDGKL